MVTLNNSLLNTTEAANYLGLAPSTLHSWRGQGKGPSYLKYGTGGREGMAAVRYCPQDLDQWLAERRIVPTASTPGESR